jgi:glucose/arabinose dehydrogenase
MGLEHAGSLAALASAAALMIACSEATPHAHEPKDAASQRSSPVIARSGEGRSACEPGCGDEPDATAARIDAGRDAGVLVPPGDAEADLLDADTPLDATDHADAGDAGVLEPVVPPKVVGIDFVPVETVTEDGQTVPQIGLTGLVLLPGEHGVLVWDKSGRIQHFLVREERFVLQGEMRLEGIHTTSDCGLISLAVDPDWEQNGLLFAGHCIARTESAVTRLEFHGNDYAAVGASAKRVLSFGDPAASKDWHNVGALGFFADPQHSLWILAGEKTERRNAQDTSKDLGKLLRIVPNREPGGSGYVPHPDNPFAGGDPANTSSPNVYGWGLRSPWRGTIDARGRIWIGDVGSDHEELNLATSAGQNFGWGLADGPCTADPAVCATFTEPLAFWNHSSKHPYRRADAIARGGTKRCIFVGVAYDASKQDRYEGFLDDALIAGDMCVGFVRAFAADDAGTLVRDQHVGHLAGISGMEQANDGFLYVTSYGSCSSSTLGFDGGIYRVVPAYDQPPPVVDPPSTVPLVDAPLGPLPLKLSQTGIFADETLTEPIARAVRFEPLLPLWSDGLDKDRWLVLPAGTQIDNSDRRAWQFPTGTLFFKTFRSTLASGESYPVETRVIRRTADGWDYNAYVWRGGDADLLVLDEPFNVLVDAATGGYYHDIPSRFDCLTCHESNDTPIIGFDELRLAWPRTGGSVSQLVELDEAGLFVQPPPELPEALAGADATSVQVIGYLHGNCAHCHNASPNAQSALSLEHEQAVDNLINQATVGHGQAIGVRVIPGDPANSVLFQAFSGETTNAEIQPMPPVGVALRDTAAIELLRGWIGALPVQ